MPRAPQFLPTTPQELRTLGWKQLDVILVTGEALFVEKNPAGKQRQKAVITGRRHPKK
jgi:hypothetical protein